MGLPQTNVDGYKNRLGDQSRRRAERKAPDYSRHRRRQRALPGERETLQSPGGARQAVRRDGVSESHAFDFGGRQARPPTSTNASRGISSRTCRLADNSRSLVLGPWSLVLGPWSLVLGLAVALQIAGIRRSTARAVGSGIRSRRFVSREGKVQMTERTLILGLTIAVVSAIWTAEHVRAGDHPSTIARGALSKVEGQSVSSPAQKNWQAPRTPWGDPDLQGTFTTDDELGVPFERPAQIGTRSS